MLQLCGDSGDGSDETINIAVKPAPPLLGRVLVLVIVNLLAGLPAAHRPRARDPAPHRPGPPNPAIAKRLSLSTKTVGNYVSNIFAKLQGADRAQSIPSSEPEWRGWDKAKGDLLKKWEIASSGR